MTKVWKADTENERYYTRTALLNVKEFLHVRTMSGAPLAGRFPGARIRITSDDPPADYFTAGTLFIVSERLKAVLEDCGARVELFPVEVTFQDAPTDSRYYFVNILDEADCLDRAASKYSEQAGYVGDIKKLVLNESQTGNKPLFRLAQAYQFVVLVSEPLAAAIEAAHVTGVRLIEPSAWRW